MRSDHESVERIDRLRLAADRKAPAFQSVLAVLVAGMESVRRVEHDVVEAALSLAHREQVGTLLDETQAALAALRGLSEHPVQADTAQAHEPSGESWWFALAEATHVLEAGIDRMSALVGSQPRGSGVRDLVSAVVRLMRNHHGQLLSEAGRWIDG